ncbi:MAG: (2Fe-2S)-binding protein [Acidimicrobiia bacterium]
MPEVSLQVNGQTETASVDPRLLLSDFLRHELGLTGTHVGCEHGVCGACTVLIDGSAARSCLVFAIQTDGRDVTTVESLATGHELHRLQECFKQHFALQCGFCTPGILMATLDYLEGVPEPSREEIAVMLSGHLCRCTGYAPIIEAIYQYSRGFDRTEPE